LQKSRHLALAPAAGADGGYDGVSYGFPVLLREGLREVRQYAAKKNVDTQPAFRDSVIAVNTAPAEGHVASGDADPDVGAGAGPAQLATAERSHPHARDLLWRCLLFPLYPSLTRKDVHLICKVLSTLP
jgi:perosamine synthetase